MNRVLAWLVSHGIAIPTRSETIEAAIAGGVVLVMLALGTLAGRTIGPRLTSLWRTRVANHAEGLAPRIDRIVRHGVAALLLLIVVSIYPWHEVAGVPIGLALGAATALTAHHLLRGLGIPRWAAWLVAVILFVMLFSRAVGGLDAISHTLDLIGFDIGRRRFSMLAAIQIVIVAIALIALVRLANRLIGHSIARSRGLDPTQKLLGQKIASITIVIAAFFIGIDLLGIDLTAFAVFSGAFGLAVGFGLQKTIGNLIAGIILLMDRSIKPGDVIVVSDKEVGWVNKIGVRAVSVITRDGKEHLIPNENLMTQAVENWSYSDRNVRVRIPVNVSYDCDLKLAQELMLRAASESPRVLDTPKPNVWLAAFGDNAVEHEILAWISDPEGGIGNVRSDVLNRLWWMFKENDIAIPYPQRDIHVRSMPADHVTAKQL